MTTTQMEVQLCGLRLRSTLAICFNARHIKMTTKCKRKCKCCYYCCCLLAVVVVVVVVVVGVVVAGVAAAVVAVAVAVSYCCCSGSSSSSSSSSSCSCSSSSSSSSSSSGSGSSSSSSSRHPHYQPPLLHTLFAHIRFTRYLQHFRHVGTSYEASKFTCEFANSSFRFWTCILGGGVGGEGR